MQWKAKARVAASLAAAGIILAGIVMTQIATEYSRSTVKKNAAQTFERMAMQLEESVHDHISIPRYGLSGFRSSMASVNQIPTAQQFHQAVSALDLRNDFPGVVGLGFIQPVHDDHLADFIAQARAEYQNDFATDASHNGATHYIVRAVAPLASNRHVLGSDLSDDPMQLHAIERAIKTDSLTITAPLRFRRSGTSTWGALYIMPVYAHPRHAGHADHASGSDSDKTMLGLIYATVNYSDALSALDENTGLASFTLYDTSSGHPIKLYSNSSATHDSHGLFTVERHFELGGRTFTFRTTSLPAFDSSVLSTPRTLNMYIFGALVTMLAALLAAELVLRRYRARRIAQKMVIELDRLAAVGKLTNDAIAITDKKGRINWVNPAFTRLYGQTEQELAKKPIADLIEVARAGPMSAFIHALLTRRDSFHGEGSLLTSNGCRRLTEIEIQPFSGHLAATTGLVVIQSDITERKRDEKDLREQTVFLDRTGAVAGVGGWQLDLRNNELTWSKHTRRIHEVPEDYEPTLEKGIAFYPPEVRKQLEAAIQMSISTGKGWDLEVPFVTYRGRKLWVRAMGAVEYEDGAPIRLTGAFQDITSKKQDELALSESRELLKVTLNSIGDGVITTDLNGDVTWLNPVAEAMIGLHLAEVIGQPVNHVLSLVDQDTRSVVENPIFAALREDATVGLPANTLLLSHNDCELGIADSAAPIRDGNGEIIGGVMVFHDVTEARALQREVSERARHDALTGLFNRHEFEERLGQFMRSVDSHKNYGAVLLIDLDHFKIVNNSGGQAAGDQLLCQISALLTARVRAHDTVARVGGDEFAILLERCTIKHARATAQSICKTIDEYRFIAGDGHVFRVGASIGIVSTEWDWADKDELIRAADDACRLAKELGRNRYNVWNNQDQTIQLRADDTAWGLRLEQALDTDGFELFGQRIISLAPGASECDAPHLEVLLRMKGPDGERISPGMFLPAAERLQLINRIDRWVVRKIFDLLSQLSEPLPAQSMIAINLSGQSVGDPAFCRFIQGLMERATFDVRTLCFEITETAAITNLSAASTFLKCLRKRDVRIALDDFGAGVASFGYLRNLRVDILKIDGQYTQGMNRNPLDMVSIKSFCEVAKVLGLTTIAEFVETEVQLKTVRELGIDFAQGYSLHRPQPLAELLEEPRAATHQASARPSSPAL